MRLSRRFQKVDIGEPSRDDAYAILLGLRKLYEEYHEVTYSDEILRRAVDLSAEHINERYLPDKAIDVVDESGASLHIYKPEQREVTEDDLRGIVSRLANINLEQYSTSEGAGLKSIAENLKKKIYGQDCRRRKDRTRDQAPPRRPRQQAEADRQFSVYRARRVPAKPNLRVRLRPNSV